MLDTLEQLLGDDIAHVALAWYFGRGTGDAGRERYLFTGAVYEAIGGRGDAPEVAGNFTAADITAVTTLSVSVHRRAAVDLLVDRADEFAALLDPERLPTDVPLWLADDGLLEAVSDLQRRVGELYRVGHVTRSKLLARKRPHLIPIRDRHVLTALVGRKNGSFMRPLRDALASDRGGSIIRRAEILRDGVGRPDLSVLRVLDIVVWMRTHGAASVGLDLEACPVAEPRVASSSSSAARWRRQT